MDGVTAYLGLGSNLGRREDNLAAAMRGLHRAESSPEADIQVLRASSIYETAPWGLETQPDFLNSALEISTRLTPIGLLTWAKAVEKKMGRRPAARNAPRVIDVDILLYDGVIVDQPDLQIPHPRLHLRAFALIPLAELDGSLVHPALKTTIQDLAVRVGGRPGVRLWRPPLELAGK